MDFLQKTSTDKITRDLQTFGNRSPATATPSASATPSSATPSSASPTQLQATSTPSSSGFSFASIFTPYTIGIVVVIVLMFGAWFAWDYYKTHYKGKSSTTSATSPASSTASPEQNQPQPHPIGGDTVKPKDLPPDSSSPPPVVTTMSPVAYAKYEKDQHALQTALGSSQKGGGGGEPVPDDAAAGAGKAGWCYIGEDQGYGVCASVQPEDKCLSGKVFPTETECIKALPQK